MRVCALLCETIVSVYHLFNLHVLENYPLAIYSITLWFMADFLVLIKSKQEEMNCIGIFTD